LVILPLEKKRCPEDIVAVAIEVLSHYDPRVTLRFTHLVAKAGVELQNISE
jgi:glycine cleavage system regulatory protein